MAKKETEIKEEKIDIKTSLVFLNMKGMIFNEKSNFRRFKKCHERAR